SKSAGRSARSSAPLGGEMIATGGGPMKFQWGSQIGEGGCGTVFRVTIEGTDREFACKRTKPGATTEDIRRFKREVRMMDQLEHDHIMPVLVFSLERDPPLFVMPLASHSLRTVVGEYAKSLDEAVEMFLKVASAVAYAHQEGIIHRDLKPENILFVNDEPMVSDVGLGRELDRQTTTITQTNANMGTFAYMSPEQTRDARDVDE